MYVNEEGGGHTAEAHAKLYICVLLLLCVYQMVHSCFRIQSSLSVFSLPHLRGAAEQHLVHSAGTLIGELHDRRVVADARSSRVDIRRKQVWRVILNRRRTSRKGTRRTHSAAKSQQCTCTHVDTNAALELAFR